MSALRVARSGMASLSRYPLRSAFMMLGTLVGYTFPSKLPAALQPAGRLIDAQGSYGKEFTIVSTAFRKAASTCGALSRRTREASSPRTTSRAQCRLFSIT